MKSSVKSIVIVGAGPAGLTAALELAKRSEYKIYVLEQSNQVGGISKTVNYKGNLIDLGGHRFFSKHDEVLQWWSEIMPIRTELDVKTITYQNKHKDLPRNLNLAHLEDSMLIRPRKSRIFYNKHFFDYPLQLKYKLLKGLGFYKSFLIALGILRSRILPIKPEKNLEDFYINRFGKELYNTFFKDYTYKVWGKHCHDISSEWGKQRVKTLSVRRIIVHSLKNAFGKPKRFSKKTETSLVEYFLYPAKGPGQMWDLVKEKCLQNGVDIRMECQVSRINVTENTVSSVVYINAKGDSYELLADHVISSMPVRPLIKALDCDIPQKVRSISKGLEYRDFLIVGLLIKDVLLKDRSDKVVSDNWLYIQDNTVKVGRLQIFNNWSPHMVKKDSNIWIGAEYFCYRTDELWHLKDSDLVSFAAKELESIGILKTEDVLDGTVVRCPKAYPSYTGAYKDFDMVKNFLNSVKNLYPIGRNGMHKYNNQDHSMLTAFKAVEMILENNDNFADLWAINTEDSYHEEKAEA